MTAGLIFGGAVVSIGGVVGTFAVGSGITVIGAFGLTGAQTFAIGAFTYDVGAILAMLFGIEVEPIEYEPINKYRFDPK